MSTLVDQARRHADEMVRYCPECGTIGPVPEGYHACCPDSFGMNVRRWQAEKMERILDRLRAASPHGVPPQPSSIQQRAIYLHEKAAMPWPDAEELALIEAGIDARAIDELIGECGYAGLASMLCTDDELRRFTRSVLVHQPASSLPQAPQGEQWISVHERLPELPVDNEDDGVKVYTWDGEFVTEDEFVPEWEQPAGPAVGGWLRTGEWFASDTASRVTHWMPRHLPAPPPLALGDSQ